MPPADDHLPDEKETPAIEISIRRYLTPEIIAAAFIRMNAEEQAEVFDEIQTQAEQLFVNSYPQMQWAYLAQSLTRDGPERPGWQFACDIGAFTMIHTYRLLEGREGRSV